MSALSAYWGKADIALLGACTLWQGANRQSASRALTAMLAFKQYSVVANYPDRLGRYAANLSTLKPQQCFRAIALPV